MEKLNEAIKSVMQSELSDSDKVEYVNALFNATDEELNGVLSPEHQEEINAKAVSCPPHVWNKTVIPYRCIYCGLTPAQV